MARKQKNKIRDGSVFATAIVYVVAVLLAIITVYPIVFVISNAISDPVASATGGCWL